MIFLDFCGENIAKTHELFRVKSCTSQAMRPGSWRMIIEKDLQSWGADGDECFLCVQQGQGIFI